VGRRVAELRAGRGLTQEHMAELLRVTVKYAQANKEGHKGKTMLAFAEKVERVHARLFQQALEFLRSGKDLGDGDIYICPVCGDLEFGALPEKCPVCGALASKFQKVA